MSVATAGLPAVCAITGNRADGAVSLRVGRTMTRWNAPKVRIPLSEPIFKRWSSRKNIYIKARATASVLTAVAVAVAFRNGALGIGILLVAIAVHLVDLWSNRQVMALEPQLERDGSDVRISGVHEAFAAAVAETVR